MGSRPVYREPEGYQVMVVLLFLVCHMCAKWRHDKCKDHSLRMKSTQLTESLVQYSNHQRLRLR
jgi:hypothetical protein